MVLGVYCAGGLGGEIMELAKEINEADNRWEHFCFINDVEPTIKVRDEVLSFEEFERRYPPCMAEVLIATGEPLSRKKLYDKILRAGYALPNLIHPNATVRGIKVIGSGNVVQDFVSFSPNNVVIGHNNVFMPFTRIAHDTVIGNHCVLAAGAKNSGRVQVADCCFIGAGAMLRENIRVGENSVIGMGAVVLDNVAEKSVMGGVPARVIRKNTGAVFSQIHNLPD